MKRQNQRVCFSTVLARWGPFSPATEIGFYMNLVGLQILYSVIRKQIAAAVTILLESLSLTSWSLQGYIIGMNKDTAGKH